MKTLLHLIGYYSNPNQDMKSEEHCIEEADELAINLSKTFEFIEDDELKQILELNPILIFSDKNRNLFAYFPYKNIARITKVIYNPKAITKVSYRLNGYFFPGETFIPREYADVHKQQIIKYDLSKSDAEYNNRDFRITTIGSDFLIILGTRTYALDWDDNYISISNLSKLIKHRWTYLYEVDTDDCCGSCDGYDYDNCDMTRCKNNCENCGGRRSICNNSCFYYRYDIVLRIGTYFNIEEIKEATDIIQKIIVPFNKDARTLYDENLKKLSDIYNDCHFIDSNIKNANDDLKNFKTLFDKMQLLNEYRGATNVKTTIIQFDNLKYRVPIEAVKSNSGGFLWLKNFIEIQDSYDFESDSIVADLRFRWKIKNSNEKMLFIKKLKTHSISHIKINSNTNELEFK